MNRMPWFRMYVDFLTDPKMVTLAFEDQRHFIGVLALKSDGILDTECAPDVRSRIVANRLWIDQAVIGDVKRRLMAAGLIDRDWQPAAWDRRQQRSDSSTERVRQHRERKQKTACNGDETLHGRYCNGAEEKRTETDEDEELSLRGNSPEIADAKPPAKRREGSGSRIPDGFPGPDELALCRERRPDLDAQWLADKFRDYWVSLPGQRARKLDWVATWRNFVRSEMPPRRGQPGAPAQRPPLTFAERDEIRAALRGERMCAGGGDRSLVAKALEHPDLFRHELAELPHLTDIQSTAREIPHDDRRLSDDRPAADRH